MLERIQRIEECWHWNTDISAQYASLVNEADAIRMLYAAHHKRRRDSVLPSIQQRLLALKSKEQKLLETLLIKWHAYQNKRKEGTIENE